MTLATMMAAASKGPRRRSRTWGSLVMVVGTRGFNHEVHEEIEGHEEKRFVSFDLVVPSCHSVSSLRSIGNSPILAHVREPWRANRSTLTSTNSLFWSISERGWVPV